MPTLLVSPEGDPLQQLGCLSLPLEQGPEDVLGAEFYALFASTSAHLLVLREFLDANKQTQNQPVPLRDARGSGSFLVRTAHDGFFPPQFILLTLYKIATGQVESVEDHREYETEADALAAGAAGPATERTEAEVPVTERKEAEEASNGSVRQRNGMRH